MISLVNKVSKPGCLLTEEGKIIRIIYKPPPETLERYCFSLHFPVSITYRIPGIVIDVSAMLVARIHFRVFGGVG